MDVLKMLGYLIASLFAVTTTVVIAIGGAILWIVAKAIAVFVIAVVFVAMFIKEQFEKPRS